MPWRGEVEGDRLTASLRGTRNSDREAPPSAMRLGNPQLILPHRIQYSANCRMLQVLNRGRFPLMFLVPTVLRGNAPTFVHSAIERPVGAFGVSDVANRRHGLFLPADLGHHDLHCHLEHSERSRATQITPPKVPL